MVVRSGWRMRRCSWQQHCLWSESYVLIPSVWARGHLLKSPLKPPPHIFFFVCFHTPSLSSVGVFSLQWFVYPQFPWVISTVIITGVGNKHTLSPNSTHKQTHAHTPTHTHIYIHFMFILHIHVDSKNSFTVTQKKVLTQNHFYY